MGGWRVEAEGSLFEVCGGRHQRERKEASRVRGDTEGATLCPGPPGPPSSHPTLSQRPALLHPAARTGQWSEPPSHRPGTQCRGLAPLPSQRPQNHGRLLASGTACRGDAWASLMVPATTTYLSPGKYVLASPSPHFWGPEVGSKQLQLQHSSTSLPDVPFLGSRKLHLSRFPQTLLAPRRYPNMTSGQPPRQLSKSVVLESPQSGFCKEYVFIHFLFCPSQSSMPFKARKSFWWSCPNPACCLLFQINASGPTHGGLRNTYRSSLGPISCSAVFSFPGGLPYIALTCPSSCGSLDPFFPAGADTAGSGESPK